MLNWYNGTLDVKGLNQVGKPFTLKLFDISTQAATKEIERLKKLGFTHLNSIFYPSPCQWTIDND